MIQRECHASPVRQLCAILQVSRSGFYRFVRQGRRGGGQTETPALLAEIRQVHHHARHSYGTRRLCRAVHAKGYRIGRVRMRTLMRQAGITVRHAPRPPRTTDSQHTLPIAPNRLNRQFHVAAPNRVWGSDITYVATREGWLYLAIVVDLFSRKIVGWALSDSLATPLVTAALEMAIGQRHPAPGLLHHSDRGSQYASAAYQRLLQAQAMHGSMSRKGECYDNAVVERVFRSLKEEGLSDALPDTRAQGQAQVINYITMFYNSHRLHSTLGYQSPNAFEAQAQSKAGGGSGMDRGKIVQ